MHFDILRSIRRPLCTLLVACFAFVTFAPAVLRAQGMSLLDVQADRNGQPTGQVRQGHGSRCNVYVSRLPVPINGANWLLITDADKGTEGPQLLSAIYLKIKPYVDGTVRTRYCAGEDDWVRQVQRVELLKALMSEESAETRRTAGEKLLRGVMASFGIGAGVVQGGAQILASLCGLAYEATFGLFYKVAGAIISKLTGADVELDGYKAMGLKGQDVLTLENGLKIWEGARKTLRQVWENPAQVAEDAWSGLVLKVLNAESAFDQGLFAGFSRGMAAGEGALNAALIVVAIVQLPALARSVGRSAAAAAEYGSLGELLSAALSGARVIVMRFGAIARAEIRVVPFWRKKPNATTTELAGVDDVAAAATEAEAQLVQAVRTEQQVIVTTTEAPPAITQGQVRNILKNSEGKPGLGAYDEGHAGAHVALDPKRKDSRTLAGGRTSTNTTTYVHERHAVQDLCNALNSKLDEIKKLPRGSELPAFEYSLPEPRPGWNGYNPTHTAGASEVSACTFSKVRVVVQKLSSGRLHIVQFTPIL